MVCLRYQAQQAVIQDPSQTCFAFRFRSSTEPSAARADVEVEVTCSVQGVSVSVVVSVMSFCGPFVPWLVIICSHNAVFDSTHYEIHDSFSRNAKRQNFIARFSFGNVFYSHFLFEYIILITFLNKDLILQPRNGLCSTGRSANFLFRNRRDAEIFTHESGTGYRYSKISPK